MAFMAPLAIPLALAGTAIEGVSAFQQSQYQAAVARNNAKIAKANAERAGFASQMEQFRSDREYDAQEATQLATQAASGLDVLGKSQIMSRNNLARVRGEQAVDIRRQGEFDVRNFQQEQANFLGEKRAARTQAWMGAAASAFELGSILSKPSGQKFVHSLIGGTK